MSNFSMVRALTPPEFYAQMATAALTGVFFDAEAESKKICLSCRQRDEGFEWLMEHNESVCKVNLKPMCSDDTLCPYWSQRNGNNLS